MPIEGPLKELGLHDVFHLLDLSRKTGILRVTSQVRRNHGAIHFDSGAIVYAEVRSNPHPLGQLLVRAGKIDEADLRRARDMQDAGDKRRLGEILVALGVMSARELERQVRLQVEEVVFEVMGWREGYFSFQEGPVTDGRVAAEVRIPTQAVLMEGARRIDEWSRIERQVPHLGVVPSLALTTGGQEGELDLLPPEWEVLAAIDGERDLRAIAQTLGRSEFDVAKTVFGLQSAGVLVVADSGRSLPAGEPRRDLVGDLSEVDDLLARGALDEARSLAAQIAAAAPSDARTHAALARIQLASDQSHEAEESARRALRLDPGLRQVHRLLGDALVSRGRFHEAAEWWTRWLDLEGDAAPAPEAGMVRRALEAARALDEVLRRTYGR